MTTRVLLVSTHRADRGHYAPLRALLEKDARFEIVYTQPDVGVVLGDRVTVAVSPYDPTRGFIVYRQR